MPIPFGVDADTGQSLEGIDPAALNALKESGFQDSVSPEDLHAKANPVEKHFGTIGEVRANNLDEAGWGVIFAPGLDPRIGEALKPLLDRRKQQAGALYKVFEGPMGFHPGDTAMAWLARQGVRMDVVDPLAGVPFYLMIVASPEQIPFEFQYGLDLYWGVGRLWFDTADEFRRYAESVVKYETQAPSNSRQIAMFAPRHDADAATQLFADEVAAPMVNGAEPVLPIGQKQKFRIQPFVGTAATRDALSRIFTGQIDNGAPALLFSGGHGTSFRPDDPRQAGSQGALVCQDWARRDKIEREEYFDATDVPANAKVHGMIHFMFACYGAGYPPADNFNRMSGSPKKIADRPMISRLPQALLAHREGGALAVLGHVDRAFGCSFRSGSNPQIQGFRDVIARLMMGERLGQATDQFNVRWAALSTSLSEELDKARIGLKVDAAKLANSWVARDDARNYVVLGDPAVQLQVDKLI